MRTFADEGKCFDPGISCVIGQDSDANHHALAYIRLTDSLAVYAKTGMRNQLFPVDTSSILEDIAIHEVYDRVLSVMSGDETPILWTDLITLINDFENQFEFCYGSFISRNPIFSDSLPDGPNLSIFC